jgi:hypothetical protein
VRLEAFPRGFPVGPDWVCLSKAFDPDEDFLLAGGMWADSGRRSGAVATRGRVDVSWFDNVKAWTKRALPLWKRAEIQAMPWHRRKKCA